ncbi:hypothetical protein KCU87_g381, partial [Aureobasidium melanogenum]
MDGKSVAHDGAASPNGRFGPGLPFGSARCVASPDGKLGQEITSLSEVFDLILKWSTVLIEKSILVKCNKLPPRNAKSASNFGIKAVVDLLYLV